mmetsp:Transcript_78895/g.150125  ORF Transcript_78895/g.150125 Transcript_78895/m.150125 type:complete len:374 (+) Transcript_78895:59-1180(+)
MQSARACSSKLRNGTCSTRWSSINGRSEELQSRVCGLRCCFLAVVVLQGGPRPAEAWDVDGREQIPALHRIFRCMHPQGDCGASLHSLQHMPLNAGALWRGARHDCVRERVITDLRLEVSFDIRCLPGLPSNVTCFSITEMYPRAREWPHGYGAFDPLQHCSGIDPDLVAAVCTLRCAVSPSLGRHAELFCTYEFDRQRKYGLRDRHVHLDFCEVSSVCVSPVQEESQLTCSVGANAPSTALGAWLLLLALDERFLVPAGCAAAILGVIYNTGGCCRLRAGIGRHVLLPENEENGASSLEGQPLHVPQIVFGNHQGELQAHRNGWGTAIVADAGASSDLSSSDAEGMELAPLRLAAKANPEVVGVPHTGSDWL